MKSLEDHKITLGKAYDLIRNAVNDDTVMMLYSGGMHIADIVRSTGLSRSTVNRIVRSAGM